MNGRFLASIAAYMLPTFPLGYTWHLITFAKEYEALRLLRPDVIIPFGVVSMLIQGVLFAWIYPRLFDTAKDRWIRSAISFGLVFGVLAWSFMVLPVAAKYQMTSVSGFIALETGFTLLQYVVASPLIALVWRGHTSVKV